VTAVARLGLPIVGMIVEENMAVARIPFNKPTVVGSELEYVSRAASTAHISGDGAFTRSCHALLEQVLGASKVLLTTSCTHALEMAAILLDVGPGDEVIVPSFTFVSTVNAFVLRGAKPVFVDIRHDTLNMDERQLERLITSRTKAIVPVHYAGVGCEMNVILDVAARYRLPVVEDNAHGLFGKYAGKYLGTFGCLATQSFHETKNFTCGEGGALVINDERLVERAEIIREKGTDRSRFYRGQVDKYTWVDVGSSYLPSEILAAWLAAQLEQRVTVQSQRRKLWHTYIEHLTDWAAANRVELPHVPSHCEQTYHMFYMVMPSLEARQRLIAHLGSHGIQSVFHYLPLHRSAMGARFGGPVNGCPVTDTISDRLIRLPFYTDLSSDDQERVVRVVSQFST